MLPKRAQPGTLGHHSKTPNARPTKVGQEKIKKSQQQASNKLDSSSGMM